MLRASIITPEAREVAELLGVAIQRCDESAPRAGSPGGRGKTKASAFAKPLSAQLPEGQLPKAWWRS